jgi:ABC-type antimicrobial peptide transport system permease subunit
VRLVGVALAWLTLRAQLRQRWRAMAGLALLLGLAGGVVLTAAAGAWRTGTAYPRLLSWANAAQVTVTTGELAPAYMAALARLPQAAAVAPEYEYTLALPQPHGTPDFQVQAWSSPDGSYGQAVDRVKITAGRMFADGTADEAVVDPQLAAMEHLRPGDTLRLLAVPPNGNGDTDLSLAFPVDVRVTGIGVFGDQVVPVTATASEPLVLLSPGFTRIKKVSSVFYLAQAAVRLRPGVSPAAFITAAKALELKYPQAQPVYSEFVNLADQVAATERAMRPEAAALGIFAGLAGLIALAVTGQLLARQLALDSAELPLLRALGATRRGLLAVTLARLTVVTAAGAVLAAAIAVAASPLMPVGAARLAEPDPGVSVNAAVLGAGLAVIALLPPLLLAGPAWRAVSAAMGPLGVAEPSAGRTRPSLLASALTSAGPVASGIGVRMALEPGRGRTAVPVRSALAGTAIAIGALVAAAVFGASLAGLTGTPARYGQNWDAELSTGFAAVPAPFAAGVLAAEPAITGYAEGDTGQVSVGGTLVPAIGVDPSPGAAASSTASGADGYLTLLAGRAPSGPGEIALGEQTMRAVHARLGQDVRVAVDFSTGVVTAGSQRARTMRVVGEVVFPDFGLPAISDTDLGSGAIVAASLLSEGGQPQSQTCPNHITCYDFFLLRYRPGTDTAAAAATLLAAVAKAGCPPGACLVTASQQPGDIQDYVAVGDTPLLLGALLAVLAVGTLAHVLLTGVRHRRRDLAVLKALGLTRAQVQGAVAWEATALAAVALLVGVPAGIIAGRLAWAAFATEAGVAAGATFDLALVLLTVPVTLLLANVIAAWPGRSAARLRPAAVLRAE